MTIVLVTSPHEMQPQRSRRPLRTLLTGVAVLALVAMFAAGVVSFLPGGLGGLTSRVGAPEVEGNLLWDSEDLAIQLGPSGWLTHPGDGGDYVARNVRTGESWTVGELSSRREITPDGVVIQPDGQRILVQREGSTRTTSTKQVLHAFRDDDLWAGTDSELLGVSEQHVVVVTCLAPKPAGLTDEVEGGRRVLAGVDLDDASIAWTRDSGAGCGADGLSVGYPSTLPAQRYLLMEPTEGQVTVVDIDTGEVAQRWSGAKTSWFAVQGEHVLASDGQDTATWSSLRTGKEVARVSCPGIRIGDPGVVSRQVSPESTPFVECGESVHVLDGDQFVEISVPPAPSNEPLADGEDLALGHLVLRREGEVVHVRDGLANVPLGDLDVPEDFVIGRFSPRGALLHFVKWERGGTRSTGSYRSFDARTGDVVVSTGEGMRSGAEASPDGIIVVESDDDGITGTRLWVAGTKEAA